MKLKILHEKKSKTEKCKNIKIKTTKFTFLAKNLM